ncbi:MAG: sucrose-6-phosphate hydrolase [Chthoniobacteraceae bacterium]
MGKPYASEVENLPETYRFAAVAPIDALIRAVRGAAAGPLVAVGSGGSLSAAHFAATLHQSVCGKIAKAMTPLESNSFPLTDPEISFLLLSAGGGNPDILDVFHTLVVREPRRLAVLTARSGTKLSRLVARYRYVDYAELEPPSGNDGFLATNSLLGFCVALSRAYGAVHASAPPLPADFFRLIGGKRQVKAWQTACSPLWERQNLVVLYPPSLQAAACDLESKFTEAAIGNVQIADYRHFAHGRHHWLAKRGESTGVLAMVTPRLRQLVDRTLRLLPASVPIARIEFPDDGAASALAALAAAIVIAGFAGKARGIDPGRPGVPAFGRQIYHLRAAKGRVSASQAARQRIIARKSGNGCGQPAPRWDESLSKFVDRLSSARFRGVVFDYDGTLCDENERFAGPGIEVAKGLLALLENEIPVGIATGRGKSVKSDLRKILPSTAWDRVVVGYYNGYELGLLSDDSFPSRDRPSPEMQAVVKELCSHPFIAGNAACEARAGQISLTPNGSVGLEILWRAVVGVIQDRNFAVVMSSHAIDVTPADVSKLAVLTTLRQIFGLESSDPILCIGDRGRPPGNDSLLLSQPYSLSVDEVSADPDVCWNLAPAGHRGVQALTDYFKAFRLKMGQFRIATQLLIKANK